MHGLFVGRAPFGRLRRFDRQTCSKRRGRFSLWFVIASRMSQYVEVTAILLSERRPPGCDNFFIAQCRVVGGDNDGAIITCVGNSEEGELKPQQTYRWFGQWKVSEQYGRQLAVNTTVPATPHTRIGVIKYLEEHCEGIGRATAEQLWGKFNADAVRVCRENPELIADTIPRLGLDKCQVNSDRLRAAFTLEGVSMALIDFFNGHNIPKSVYKESLKRHGNNAVNLYSHNPYLLCAFRGVGFLKADAIYCKLGLPPGKLKRQVLCLDHELKGQDDTWVLESAAKEILTKKIAGASVNLPRAVSVGLRGKRFSVKRNCSRCQGSGRSMVPDLFFGEEMTSGPCPQCQGNGGVRWLALRQRAANELLVAEKAAAILKGSADWPDVGSIPHISDHQRAALAKAFRGALACFIGGPGTGKSFATAALVAALIEKFGISNVAAAAPTNKAAHRLTQGFQANDIGLRATSIHSLLGVAAVEDGNWQFNHNRNNPLPHRVLLLDEQSMLSTDLAACLFDAINPGTLVLMIGDVGQLPPIQHGAVLRDFLSAGIPTGELTEPQRNAGDLVFACNDIRQGIRFRESEQIDLNCLPPKNFKFIPARTPEEQIDQLWVLLEKAAANGVDPIWDCQVMTPVNRTSKVSKDALNKLIQERFNPGDQSTFRAKDKVICDENGFYDSAGSEEKTFIAKGEFGQVMAADRKHVTVRFDGERRTVLVPISAARKSSLPGAGPQAESSCPISLAYACTVHRMQGSETKLAIPIIDESPGAKWLGCRELFFTAISRGKLLTRPIGSRSTADQMCKKVLAGKRKTFLAELVKERLKGSEVDLTAVASAMAIAGGMELAGEVEVEFGDATDSTDSLTAGMLAGVE